MKMRMLCGLLFFSILTAVCSEVNENLENKIVQKNFYQLVIQCMQSSKAESKKLAFLNFFYKGNAYRVCVNDVIGSQINIFDDGEIPHNMIIVVSNAISPIYNNDAEKIVTGLKASDGAAWYTLLLKVVHGKNNTMSYRWEIKKIDAYQGNSIPRDALVIESKPNAVSFVNDDNFLPDFPTSCGDSGSSRLLFLPLISYNEDNKDKEIHDDEDGSECAQAQDCVEISQCHIVCP